MAEAFEIENGVLRKYHGAEARVTLPGGVREIGNEAFAYSLDIVAVDIPEGVTRIGESAFCCCRNLAAINIPSSVRAIDKSAFSGCIGLTAIAIPDGVAEIRRETFRGCTNLASVAMPGSVTKIEWGAFESCTYLASIDIPSSVTTIEGWAFGNCTSLTSVVIPGGVTEIEDSLFAGCWNLASVCIPDAVTKIGGWAFYTCSSLTSIEIPAAVTEIGWGAFIGCGSLTSIVIPDAVTAIRREAFARCESLASAIIPESVVEIEKEAFRGCPVTVVCPENSPAHRYCAENHITYVFDYQFEAFDGLLPQGFEKLASPFLADEEGPYVFVSYSHRDRDEILPIIKGLYENGWRVWYDEGLTIGDKYDETLEGHVKNCAAFLLFVTAHSRESIYIRENEVPWAIEFGRPVVECMLDGGKGYGIEGVVASVPSSGIGQALEQVGGLVKGGPRIAAGISVVVDPTARSLPAGSYAYCLYSDEGSATARAILLDAKRAGCAFYDAVEGGIDLEKLWGCACLVVFLDKAFLRNLYLQWSLVSKYQMGWDIAICALEDIGDVDLPEKLAGLDKEQWLDFAHGISADMCTKLARYLQAKGCRDVAVLPGFEYEETDRGIVITRFVGTDPAPRIPSAYGGVLVVGIADGAFENCAQLKTVSIPEGVTEIGESAFADCTRLTSVDIPSSMREIGESAFARCTSLASVVIPDGVAEIKDWTFTFCEALVSVDIPATVTSIGKYAFEACSSLTAVEIPNGVTQIGRFAFWSCTSLVSVSIPNGVAAIEEHTFTSCSSLASVSIPNSVTAIGKSAFQNCTSLVSVDVPDSVTRIGEDAFYGCTNLTSVTLPNTAKMIGESAFGSCPNLTVTRR